MTRVGLISDTHGLLRAEAVQFLAGSDMIIHCGDICDAGVIAALSRIAPVHAVRGNNDTGPWADDLPESATIRIDGVLAYVIHDVSMMDIDPLTSGVAVVLSGHSHKPSVVDRDGVTYMNPGSAGPRRFKLPICMGELIIEGQTLRPRIVELGGEARSSG